MKKLSSQIIWIFLSLLLLLAFGWRTHTFAAESQAEAQTVIRVGYTEKGQMIEKNGTQFTGYGVAYLQMLEAYTDWQFEYVPVAEENRIEELKNGTIDLLCDITADEANARQIILSDKSCCLHYALLCADKNDTSVFYNEYEAMNGKRIAVNKSRNMEHLMSEFAEEHGIEYTPVYCSSFSEMEAALENGSADLLVASNQRELEGYKYVATMCTRDEFFAVSQEHPELMEELNDADHQLKTVRPFIAASLYETYYGRPSETLTGTTREEYEFIQSNTPVRVVCDSNSMPIAYVDEKTGSYSGIYADAMALIQEESGLNFEFIPIEDYKNAWLMLESGEADMSTGMYVNDSLTERYGLLSSASHLSANYTMISRTNKAFEGELTIAMSENHTGIQAYVKEHYPEWQIIQAKDTHACLKMAESGEVDGALINSVFLQTVYNLNSYSNLMVLPMHSVDIPISCVFSGSNAPLLRDIVNKAIQRIPAESFANCIIENSVKITYKPTMSDILRMAFPFFVLILIIFAMVYLLTLWFRERHYRYLAMTDSITGLWNGRNFRRKAEELLSHNHQKNYQIISMDMEHFKYVNTDFGEKAADYVLLTLGSRLRQLLGSDALYAREMSDMFLILAESSNNWEEFLYKLSKEIPFDNNGISQCYKPDIKFGICNIKANEQTLTVNEYIDRASAARKSIKKNPVQGIAYYDQRMEEAVSHVTKIEKKMEASLKNGEFVVYYQPKYLLESESIIGAEALIRWQDPEEGMIFPNDFIPIFERNGFIIQLDFFVYEEVLKTIAKWRAEGRKDIIVSVNVSRAHIGTSDFLTRLVALADRYQVPHGLLELELTETVLGGKRRDILDFIHQCKAKGFPISIDDFGSGYSSLNLLKDLPVDVLKIDREFLNETEVSEKSRIIIEQIVEMAGKIHIHTLCEGVENRVQEAFLKKIGCDMTQGYLYSKPVSLDIFEELLEADR